jgi:hypothetical protein
MSLDSRVTSMNGAIIVELGADTVQALADEIADRLDTRLGRPARSQVNDESDGDHVLRSRPLTTKDVAAMLGRSAAWVRQHRHELGAITISQGPRPRLMFDPATVADRLTSRSESERSQAAQQPVATGLKRRRPRRTSGTNAELLPFRGSERLREDRA